MEELRNQPPLESSAEDAWTPGVVHVVFKEPFDRETLESVLADPGKESDAFPVVRQVAREFGPLNFAPTFSIPPLTREENPPPGRERYYTLYFPRDRDVVRIAERLREDSSVERAAPAPQIAPPSSPLGEPYVQASPSDPDKQWYIPRCKIDQAWSLKQSGFFSGLGVVVADIDWGFLTSHPEFNMRIEYKYNSLDGTNYVDEGNQINHGTAVLGLLGAGANGQGMAGVAYGASLWAIQADDGADHDPSLGAFPFWVKALDHVRTTDSGGRPKIICLEAETKTHLNIESDIAVNKAIRDAIAAKIVVCVPAGNGGQDAGMNGEGLPFECTDSILVGATIFDAAPDLNIQAAFSNWGERVVVSAPGDRNYDLTCSSGADPYQSNFGQTSGSTPKVAGTVALMLEANPSLTHAEIRSILKATGSPIDGPQTKPIGTFLNACAAVQEAQLRASGPLLRLARRVLSFLFPTAKKFKTPN